MSQASDLAQLYAMRAITVPVQYGDRSTRGFLTLDGSTPAMAGLDARGPVPTLYIQTGTLGELEPETSILVGAEGEAAIDEATATRFLLEDAQPHRDRLEQVLFLAGGAA